MVKCRQLFYIFFIHNIHCFFSLFITIFCGFCSKNPQKLQENLKKQQELQSFSTMIYPIILTNSNVYFINIAGKQGLTQYSFLSNVLFCALEGLTTLQNLCDNERVAELGCIICAYKMLRIPPICK